jgi:hypothetical protein
MNIENLSKGPKVGDWRVKVWTCGTKYKVFVQQYMQFFHWKWWGGGREIYNGWDKHSKIEHAKAWINQRMAQEKTEYITHP